MSIESNIIRSNVQKTSLWSGGKTTEIFIYPETADYASRNFDIRISTATVETETSTFTLLPQFERYLMILEGEMRIKHEDGDWFELKPFEVDKFGGGQHTQSEGKVRDFNVMVSPEFEAILATYKMNTESWIDLDYREDFIHFIYCVEGTVQVQLEQNNKIQRHFLYSNDGFFLESKQMQSSLEQFRMKALKDTGIAIHVIIKQK